MPAAIFPHHSPLKITNNINANLPGTSVGTTNSKASRWFLFKHAAYLAVLPDIEDLNKRIEKRKKRPLGLSAPDGLTREKKLVMITMIMNGIH